MDSLAERRASLAVASEASLVESRASVPREGGSLREKRASPSRNGRSVAEARSGTPPPARAIAGRWTADADHPRDHLGNAAQHFHRPSDLLRIARLRLQVQEFARLFYEIYDILTMSAYDYLTKWFESDAVIAALGYYVHGGGTNASMKMPATAFSCIRLSCARQHDRGRQRRLRARRHGLDLERDRTLGRGARARGAD